MNLNEILTIVIVAGAVGIIYCDNKIQDTRQDNRNYVFLALFLAVIMGFSGVTILNNHTKTTTQGLSLAQSGLDKILLTKEDLTATENWEVAHSNLFAEIEVWGQRHQIAESDLGKTSVAILNAMKCAKVTVKVDLPKDTTDVISKIVSWKPLGAPSDKTSYVIPVH